MKLSTLRAAVLADWGPTIKAMAYTVATAVAFTYVAGMALGTWVHGLNASLTALIRTPLAPPAPTTQPILIPPTCSPLLDHLEAMTCGQLRELAGISGRKLRKHQLIARVAALPI